MKAKRFKTLKEARQYLKTNGDTWGSYHVWRFPNAAKRVNKYFVGTYLDWMNAY